MTPVRTPGRHRTSRHLAALAVVAALGLGACGDDTAEPPATDPPIPTDTTPETMPATSTPSDAESLDGRTFLSTATTGFDLVEGTRVRIQFVDGRFSASAGCNILGATYLLDDGALRVDGGIEMTEMGCESALMTQDSRLADLLGSSPTVTLDGDTLTIASSWASITLLDRRVAEPDRPLADTLWQLTTLIDGDSASSVPNGSYATLQLADGRLLVATGCNTGSATATVTGGTLVLGPLMLTRKACSDELMRLESSVVAVLDGTITFTIEADSLTLTRGDLGLGYLAVG
jgi:heat shock protein HslJ